MPAFSFDPTSGRYRNASGKLVSQAHIRGALDSVLRAQAVEARNLTAMLGDGILSLGDWERLMMANIKATHLVSATTANGGWASMTQADFGWVGQRIRTQYDYLRGFASDIATGKQALTASAQARAELYAEAGRQTHRAAETRQARKRGADQERNVLGVADHCAGCLRENAQGWVPIGDLVPCGARQCRVRCHCHLVYRRKPILQTGRQKAA